MKQIILLLIVVACCSENSFSQKNKRNDRTMTSMQVDGYRVHIFPAMENSYGYEIWNDNKRIVYQSKNPFTMNRMGLKTKEDAIKTATWLIRTVIKSQSVQTPNRLPLNYQLSRPIPRKVAEQLKIDIS